MGFESRRNQETEQSATLGGSSVVGRALCASQNTAVAMDKELLKTRGTRSSHSLREAPGSVPSASQKSTSLAMDKELLKTKGPRSSHSLREAPGSVPSRRRKPRNRSRPDADDLVCSGSSWCGI